MSSSLITFTDTNGLRRKKRGLSDQTSILLMHSYMETVSQGWSFDLHLHIQNFFPLDMELKMISMVCTGGDRALDCVILAGAYEKIDVREFIRLVKSLPWQHWDQLQLFYKEPGMTKFAQVIF